ncbi:signal peptide peptidase SppA [Catenovulum adriaticum]|uniref:Signal peptide peptidase SppA n=1 Tax=Catenovulum adriaticum TaxID=2984846 RepID=A0ABY7ANM8_9ALTE|nr:signal peptide peptidase SppA [Catenovulum sp. TS8]WAJ70905.1 signal peptide peptidase SppA [Catenovulum sp. TS8]
MSTKNGVSRLFSALWGSINFTRKLLLNLLFFGVIAVIIVVISTDKQTFTVPDKTALLLDLSGNIVEQKQTVNPIDNIMMQASGSPNQPAETLLSDVLNTLDAAKTDSRIKAIVLDLKNMTGAGLNKLEAIGDKLNQFKATGKPVYAIGDYYTKSQYFLASYADEIILHPMGFVLLDGFSNYQLYYKSALEKLKVSTHIFRVGTYKSFVEPYIRDDMSEAAKTASKDWLSRLWHIYKTDVAKRRDIDINNFDEELDVFRNKFEESNYDFAQYALNNHWVDSLKNREEVEQTIANIVGWKDNKRSYNKVNFEQYLSVIKKPKINLGSQSQVAIIVAAGNIYDGKQLPGSIGGDSTAKLLEKARLNDQVKAVVLRIDSPGGSAFASEIIRREIDLLQAANKPVIASMSSTAASGGYWIASSADEIWAHPATITGSIGVFGMFMTFENTLDYLGVHTDGVKTTEWPPLTPTISLDEKVGDILQKSTERAYQRFLQLVSEHRNMTIEDANKIAQGRVWTGEQALELGLVDKLGNLAQAVKSAAEHAGLDGDYSTLTIEQDLTPQQQLVKEIFGQASSWLGHEQTTQINTQLQKQINQVIAEYHTLNKWNDPKGHYAWCVPCKIE